LNRFNNLQNLGQVYAMPSGKVYKIRLGVYASRQEAEQALRGVKAKGYSDAFIVQEAGSGATTQPSSNPVTSPTNTTGTYMVQLGAYSKPQYFNRSKAEALGTVITRSRGNLTLFLLTGMNSIDQARSMKSRANSSGWPDAFIVQDQGGTLVKMK